MVFGDQDLPSAAVLSKAPDHTFAPIGNADPAPGPAKRVRPGINRVGQDMMDGVVNRQFPNQAAPIIDCIVHRRQQNTFEAGATTEKATKASEEVAGYENLLAAIDARLSVLT